jgi:hypothetical protein
MSMALSKYCSEILSFPILMLLEELSLLPVVACNVIVGHGLGFVAHLAHGLTLFQHLKGL